MTMRSLFLRGSCAALLVTLMAAGPSTTPATPAGTQPATATAPQPRIAVPPAADQSRALALIHNVFKDEYARKTPADRQTLARRLLAEAAASVDQPAARYVLLNESETLATACGDIATAVAAATARGQAYTLDPLELSCRAALRTQPGQTLAANETFAEACLALLPAAVEADRFDLAEPLAAAAEAAALKTRKIALVAAMQPRLVDFRQLAAEHIHAIQARATLARDPDDPAAHGILGRYLCLRRGRWSEGLPHLAKGPDTSLRALALRELAPPADVLAQVALADGWWDAAAALSGPPRQQAAAHAVGLYRAAEASLTGITLSRIRVRVQDGAPATGPAATQPAPVNLAALVDPAKDAVEGTWQSANGALLCAAAKHARLQLPYRPSAEYDFNLRFTRTAGSGAVVLLLPAYGTAFGLSLDSPGHGARIETVNKKIDANNPTRVDCKLENNRAYHVLVEVRKNSVKAYLDGQLLTQYHTDYQDLARYRLWQLHDDTLPGLGAAGSAVTFLKVEILDVTGQGKPAR